MASKSNPTTKTDSITLVCTNPNPTPNKSSREILISTDDVVTWNSPSLLNYHSLKILTNRHRLVEHSTYFRGLLGGSFSESWRDSISIQWDLESVLNMLKCIYGCSLEITSSNFLSLFEGALYFGVELVLSKCKDWFSEVCSSRVFSLMPIQLDDLIKIWNFGMEHEIDFLLERCVTYLAKNFMYAVSDKAFVDIHYTLLYSCIKHQHLTVESEMHLSDAVLIWIDAKTDLLECMDKTEDQCSSILKEIHICLLPLWFAAGKQRTRVFSKLAGESINTIFNLIRDPYQFSLNMLGDGSVDHLKIRLSEYSKKVDLSSCPQITSAILLLSLLPSSYIMDCILDRDHRFLQHILEHFDRGQFPNLCKPLPVLSFKMVKELNISKCSRMNLGAAIDCFCKSFPSLKIFKATHLLKFSMETLWVLIKKCHLVSDVDLTVDVSPLIPSQVSVKSSSYAVAPLRPKKLTVMENSSNATSLYYSEPLSNITKLTLQGRTDVHDFDLQLISNLCKSLCYLNIKGCISVTDAGISTLIQTCIELHSIVACDTSFGSNSALALCSTIPSNPGSVHEETHFYSTACKLQMLHIGGCKGIVEKALSQLISQAHKLKSFCLRDTMLQDNALRVFSGSSLENLDVSNTQVSGEALAYIVRRNPGLKCLKARGCNHLLHEERNSQQGASFYSCKELYDNLGKICGMEELVMGWGMSSFSLEVLRPAVRSLRAITLGLGASFGEDDLKLLPKRCPALESLDLYFQVISDSIIISLTSLMNLRALALCYCFGNISMSSFSHITKDLRKLKLERVANWMSNEELHILTQKFSNLTELSLVGCRLLNSDAQKIISCGWPGMISIHLEDCGKLTENGVSCLLNCNALEDILLRHSGPGIPKKFIFEAASKLPMLRHLSLDLCDAVDSDFDIPDYNYRYFFSTIKIARCKHDRSSLDILNSGPHRRMVHKESLVLVWNSENLVRTVVKERL